MSIVNSIIQRKAGLPSVHTERKAGIVTGHLNNNGGLAGHSVDQSVFPWRVVGKPGGEWEVQDVRGVAVKTFGTDRFDACGTAHYYAEALKILYPHGWKKRPAKVHYRLHDTGEEGSYITTVSAFLDDWIGQDINTGQTHDRMATVIKVTYPTAREIHQLSSMPIRHTQKYMLLLGSPWDGGRAYLRYLTAYGGRWKFVNTFHAV